MDSRLFLTLRAAACAAALALSLPAAAQQACDIDGDGAEALACGGGDCDDQEAAVGPDAAEIASDGIDQDCDGLDPCEDAAAEPASNGCSTAPGLAGPAWALALLALGLRRRR